MPDAKRGRERARVCERLQPHPIGHCVNSRSYRFETRKSAVRGTAGIFAQG